MAVVTRSWGSVEREVHWGAECGKSEAEEKCACPVNPRRIVYLVTGATCIIDVLSLAVAIIDNDSCLILYICYIQLFICLMSYACTRE